jgi:hypothetical protein
MHCGVLDEVSPLHRLLHVAQGHEIIVHPIKLSRPKKQRKRENRKKEQNSIAYMTTMALSLEFRAIFDDRSHTWWTWRI